MRDELRELFRYRELIGILVRREIRLRYKNSVLGFFWSIVPLVMQVIVLSVVVKFVFQTGPQALSAYILCAYIPWNFLQNSLLESSSSVLAQYGLLKKVYFPREILPIATVLGNGVHLALALGVFFVYRYLLTPLLFGWPGPPPMEILWLPAVLAITILLAIGLGFFLSALNVFHEDIKFITQSLLNIAFFALPISWFTEQMFYSRRIPQALRHPLTVWYNANPFSWVITAYRQILLPRATLEYRGGVPVLTAGFDYRYFALAAVLSTLIALAGYRYFNRRKWQFVERP